MKLLLDKHVLLWWLDSPALLSADAQAAIADRANEVLISAAVAWEISIKQSIGKLTVRGDIEQAIQSAGFNSLPMMPSHAWGVKVLAMIHRDPFDRLLISQAIAENATIVTRDAEFGKYPVAVLPA